jgi:hypothetical protein
MTTDTSEQNVECFIHKYGPSRHENLIISDMQRLIIRWTFTNKIDYKLNDLSHKLFDLLLVLEHKNINTLFNVLDTLQ